MKHPRLPIRGLIVTTGVLFAIYVGLTFLGLGFFSWTSVCTDCGARRHSIKLFYVLPIHMTKQTRLSRFAHEAGLLPDHEHTWLFGSGSGAGVMCAIGKGRHLYGSIESPDIVTFLRAILRHRGPAATRHWLKQVLDPDQALSYSIYTTLEPDILDDKERFDIWLEEAPGLQKEFTR